MELIRLRSLDELTAAADCWNELWQLSEVGLPAARAESVAAWLEQFASPGSYELLVVADAGRWSAALPLVDRRIKGLVPAAGLPYSPWWHSGELLHDPRCDVETVLDVLVRHLAGRRRPLCWLDAIRFETPRWQAFLAALERAGLPWVLEQQGCTGQVEIEHDWRDYRSRWSRSHRRQMAAAERRAEEAGGVELQVHKVRPGEDLKLLVRRGFEVEHRSWKGAAGSSVLSEPGMLEYYCEQARRLGKSGQVELAFLEHRGQPIAFEYALAAKGTYYSYKVGYDPQFSDWKPGQLLRMKLLERFHADPSRRLFDFLGPLTDATARWSTKAEPVGRLVVGSPSLVGRTLANGYRLWTRRRRLSGRAERMDEPKLGVRSRSLAGTAQAV